MTRVGDGIGHGLRRIVDTLAHDLIGSLGDLATWPDKISSAFEGMGDRLKSVWDGIGDRVRGLTDTVANLLEKISKAFSLPERTPLDHPNRPANGGNAHRTAYEVPDGEGPSPYLQRASYSPAANDDHAPTQTTIASTVAATLIYLDGSSRLSTWLQNQLGLGAGGPGVGGSSGGSGGGGGGQATQGGGSPGTASTVPLDLVQNIHDRIHAALPQLPETSIAAVIGSGVGESGLNPLAIGAGGDTGTWQWTGDRKGKYWREFAPGEDLHTAGTNRQTDYLIHELQGRYRGVLNRLSRPGISAAEANSTVTHDFEGPSDPDTQTAKRLPMTEEILRRLNGRRSIDRPAPQPITGGIQAANTIDITVHHDRTGRLPNGTTQVAANGPMFRGQRVHALPMVGTL